MQAWSNVTWSRKAEFDGDGGPDFRKGGRVPGKLFFPGVNAKAGGGKPAEDRWVPFHKDLEDHLTEMYNRRDPSSDWMFPKRRGAKGHTLRFNKQLERVKRELRAKHCDPDDEKSYWFDRVTFQWFRHYFISHAVMAGIDFKTIAYWVSHRDGGVLIGRLYGHLDTRHSEQMSAKLSAHLDARR
jgi:integrase